MVEFSVKNMLALRLIRERVLELKYGVRWVGVATIKVKSDESGWPYMYDHNGRKLPEWQWLIVRSDMKRFRIRTSYNNSKSTFRCGEYPFWGPPPETMGPPSTGPGHDSKRKKTARNFSKLCTVYISPMKQTTAVVVEMTSKTLKLWAAWTK